MGLVPHLLLEALLVAVELLHGEGADDAAQVAGDRLLDGGLDVVHRHPEETLRRLADVVDVALHLDLGHRLDVDGDALDRVDVLEVDVERHHPQRQDLEALPRRPDEGAAAADDPEPLDLAGGGADLRAGQLAAAVDDQGLVRSRLLVAAAHRHVAEEEKDRDRDQEDREQLHGHGLTSAGMRPKCSTDCRAVAWGRIPASVVMGSSPRGAHGEESGWLRIAPRSPAGRLEGGGPSPVRRVRADGALHRTGVPLLWPRPDGGRGGGRASRRSSSRPSRRRAGRRGTTGPRRGGATPG